MSAEAAERRKLHAAIDNALVGLDTDGLRFVLVVAQIRGMTSADVVKLHERIKDEQARDTVQRLGIDVEAWAADVRAKVDRAMRERKASK